MNAKMRERFTLLAAEVGLTWAEASKLTLAQFAAKRPRMTVDVTPCWQGVKAFTPLDTRAEALARRIFGAESTWYNGALLVERAYVSGAVRALRRHGVKVTGIELHDDK